MWLVPSEYDFGRILDTALLFYDAQRSGAITNLNNAVPWRGDSHLGDQYNGTALLGGWYDEGGTIKMTYSVASAVMMLSWGLHEFKSVSGQARRTWGAVCSGVGQSCRR